MRYTGRKNVPETAPPPGKRRTPPTEQTNEVSSLIDEEQVDIEREAPLAHNQSIERIDPDDEGERPMVEG